VVILVLSFWNVSGLPERGLRRPDSPRPNVRRGFGERLDADLSILPFFGQTLASVWVAGKRKYSPSAP